MNKHNQSQTPLQSKLKETDFKYAKIPLLTQTINSKNQETIQNLNQGPLQKIIISNINYFKILHQSIKMHLITIVLHN